MGLESRSLLTLDAAAGLLLKLVLVTLLGRISG